MPVNASRLHGTPSQNSSIYSCRIISGIKTFTFTALTSQNDITFLADKAISESVTANPNGEPEGYIFKILSANFLSAIRYGKTLTKTLTKDPKH